MNKIISIVMLLLVAVGANAQMFKNTKISGTFKEVRESLLRNGCYPTEDEECLVGKYLDKQAVVITPVLNKQGKVWRIVVLYQVNQTADVIIAKYNNLIKVFDGMAGFKRVDGDPCNVKPNYLDACLTTDDHALESAYRSDDNKNFCIWFTVIKQVSGQFKIMVYYDNEELYN